jgi:hypothetical protein
LEKPDYLNVRNQERPFPFWWEFERER